MQVREKVGKSRNTVFFQWFVAPEGRKVGSLKRRVRSHLARWEMKNCTPLWREAHFEVNMYKAHQLRTTFGSCDVEKVHAVVAQSTLPSQNVKSTRGSDHIWKLRCWKIARRCGAKHVSNQKCKNLRGTEHFWTFRCAFAWQAQRIVPCQKWAKREGFVAFPKTMAGVGHLKRIFSTLDRWSGKIARRIGTRPSALHSTFDFWRKSRRIALFLMLSNSKIEEVSQ